MILELDYEDLKIHMPRLLADFKKEWIKEMEEDKFLTYPKGLGKHLCDGVYTHASYQRVKKIWDNPNFPRKEKDGIRGVYLSDLKEFGL